MVVKNDHGTAMKNSICPLCGKGGLMENDIWGFECQMCGEVFEYDENEAIQIVDFEKWLGKLNICRTRNYDERRN